MDVIIVGSGNAAYHDQHDAYLACVLGISTQHARVMLHSFISKNMEDILQRWENFARNMWPDENPSIEDLRDHAQEMLLAIVNDMQNPQSEVERHDKSVGEGWPSAASELVDSSSARHAETRVKSGFDIIALVAEYRALRASVLQLWSQSTPDMNTRQIEEMTRFNESVDQLLAKSVLSYTQSVERSREMLLGILGHDLKSPLCAVSMMAGLLEEDRDLSEPSRQMASQIVVAAREMQRLVSDLLNFSGSHLGAKMHVSRQSMCLEELCREVLEEIGAAHPSCVFDLETNGDGNGEWDRSRLRQLISNLLVNAVQHGSAQSPIRLFIRTKEDAVTLGVCNQGPPIPAPIQKVMFDPLRRFSCDGSWPELGNLGLGLYIAREVAIAHGGVINVRSDERETAFIVKLPRRDKFQSKRTYGENPNGRGSSLETAKPTTHAGTPSFG